MAEDLNFLQQKARDWALKVVELNNTSVPPEMMGKKTMLINAAKKIKTMIEKIVGAAPYLAPMNQLGFLPILLAAGGITTALAAIVKWTTDYAKFKTEVSEYNKLVNTGMSAQQASNIIFNRSSFSITNFAKYALPAIAAAGVVWFITRKKRS